MMKLRNLFAYYNTHDDTIYNCEEGSLLYYHELRHRFQFHDPIIKKIDAFVSGLADLTLPYYVFFGWLFIYTRLVFWTVAIILYSPKAFFIIILEVDAWISAFKTKLKLS